MDMDQEAIIAGAAQGDLADVVARAGAMAALPFTSHHQPPPSSSPAAADHMPLAPPGQIVNPYYEEDRRLAAGTFEAAPSKVDPYLPSSITAPHGGYWLPPTAAQISHHACGYGRDMLMTGSAAAAEFEGDDAMRSSPVTPAAASAHQMMTRKNDVKKVVCIPAPPATNNRTSGEVIPSDLWAWRKYGQKPIKGSPYPRGYYRCSSSKGCMARKQVERSRSDPNMLVITYTAEHNHPWPMQRNVLAGYSRPHTHVSTNCKKKINYPTSSSSSSRNIIEQNVVANGDLEYQHSTNMMGALSNQEGHVPVSCNGIQPTDEVFSELEELGSSNNVNANAYSRGVGYEWNKF